MTEVLRERVQQYLALSLLSNATFLCERLHAASQSHDSALLLAQCYQRAGRYPQARW